MRILPRPVSPRSALSDLRLMFSADRPHRWTLLGLAATITGLLMWGFIVDSRNPEPERQITYVESWMADRKDSAIIRQQLADLDTYEGGLEDVQKRYQKVADAFGIEWREEAAQNKQRRLEVMAAIRKQLEQRLATAEAREAADKSGRSPGLAAAH